MEHAIVKSLAASTLLASVLIPLPLFGQARQSATPSLVRYSLLDLGRLGGSASNGFGGPNNRGWVTGDANLVGDQTEHGFLWRDGVIADLGTLGGLNSSVSFPVKNNRGVIAGVTQTATADPLGEFWGTSLFCSATANCEGFQNLEIGFIWQDGAMTPLPTLGGNNGAATGVNNLGQVVGAAETNIQDPNCAPPQILDFDAVIWGPKPNEIHVLPPLPGDSVAAALAINDNGEVVGGSGKCALPPSLAFALHPVLWRHGAVTNLGGLGGQTFNIAFAINNRGEVVGQSDLPSDTFAHAFLWQDGRMTDLGTLPGDSISMASDINNKGQVVGTSCDASFNCRAFLWEDGVMTDLNTLVSESPLFLTFGGGINDRGEIAGSAFKASTGEAPAFLAVPHLRSTLAQGEKDSVLKTTLPENVRRLLQQRMHGRGPGFKP